MEIYSVITGIGLVTFFVGWLLWKFGRVDRKNAIYFLLGSFFLFVLTLTIASLMYSDVPLMYLLFLRFGSSAIKIPYILSLTALIYAVICLISPGGAGGKPPHLHSK